MSKKFSDLVHYICWKRDDPASLGATKLNKIAWFVDTIAFRRDGSSLTGEAYVKQARGPVPKNVLSVLNQLQADGKIVVREPQAEFQPREFFAMLQPDMSSFAQRDMALIDQVMGCICSHHTAGSISEVSHDQIWEAAAMALPQI